ncbi:hypothetical protein, partial [uncultured Porphyromonas sp.]|uniref:hypothetical protein n=1 Tax=uncultured Porphyromonas sp. TaxID=159274 RepID=UPI002616A83E
SEESNDTSEESNDKSEEFFFSHVEIFDFPRGGERLSSRFGPLVARLFCCFALYFLPLLSVLSATL